MIQNSKKPLSKIGASVVLLNPADSVLVSFGTTDEKADFLKSKCKTG